MYKDYVFRMYPDDKQRELTNKSFEVSRFIYNHFSEEKQTEYKNKEFKYKEMGMPYMS